MAPFVESVFLTLGRTSAESGVDLLNDHHEDPASLGV